MPHNRSAEKRLRKNEKRRVANKTRLTELKTIEKRLRRALNDGKKDEAETLYRTFSKRIDQAASVSTVHRKNAARHKSRLALALAKAGKPAAPTA